MCDNTIVLVEHAVIGTWSIDTQLLWYQVQEQLHVMCQWIAALLLCSQSNIIYAFKFLTSFGMSVGYVDDDDDDDDDNDLLKLKLVCLASESILLYRVVIGVL